MDIVEGAFDPETADPGTIVWHTSDGEGGPPDVAYQVILAKGESLWIGDITRDRYEDAGGEKMGLGGDGGWWLIHYKGRDATVLGKVNHEQASDIADLVSGLVKRDATITALRKRVAELEGVLEPLVDEFGSSIEQYDRIGPDWTHKDGTEVFEVSTLLDRRELIDRARAALAAMGEREAKPRPHGEGQ